MTNSRVAVRKSRARSLASFQGNAVVAISFHGNSFPRRVYCAQKSMPIWHDQTVLFCAENLELATAGL
jgi:hypothetical protein